MTPTLAFSWPSVITSTVTSPGRIRFRQGGALPTSVTNRPIASSSGPPRGVLGHVVERAGSGRPRRTRSSNRASGPVWSGISVDRRHDPPRVSSAIAPSSPERSQQCGDQCDIGIGHDPFWKSVCGVSSSTDQISRLRRPKKPAVIMHLGGCSTRSAPSDRLQHRTGRCRSCRRTPRNTPHPWPSTAWAAGASSAHTIAPSTAMYTVTGTTSPWSSSRGQNHTSMPTTAATTTAAARQARATAPAGQQRPGSTGGPPGRRRGRARNDGFHHGIAGKKSPAADNSGAGTSHRRSRRIGWHQAATASSTAIAALAAGWPGNRRSTPHPDGDCTRYHHQEDAP